MGFADIAVQNPPDINVLDQEKMQERVEKIFSMVGESLGKSFGPMGSHTLISQHPYYHVTKDGFTILKFIRFNHQEGPIDMVILDMISSICSRLNYSVGDGTTSAVLATNSMFRSFMKYRNDLFKYFPLPRIMLHELKKISNDILDELNKRTIKINTLPVNEMVEYIRDVVYVSSNADKETTDIITELYREMEYPGINVTKAADGVTKGEIVKGFMFPAHLMDRLYINSDDDTQKGTNYDVVIFDHKVGLDAFRMILQPIQRMSLERGRKLVCIAPMYDDVALNGDIRNELNSEYARRHDISLILMSFKCNTGYEKKQAADLAMLCNTDTITKAKEMELLVSARASKDEYNAAWIEHLPINIDDRDIPGIRVKMSFEEMSSLKNPTTPFKTWEKGMELSKDKKYVFRVGFAGNASLSLTKQSVFSGFIYDEGLYEKYLLEAKKDLDAAIEKYKKLGTFNFEIDEAQARYLGLKMKMGQISVGANSEFSQDFLMDAMVDAVKAAESSWQNGIVVGGHVSLLSSINALIEKELAKDHVNDGRELLLRIIFDGIKDVREQVFSNGFRDGVLAVDSIDIDTILEHMKMTIGFNVVIDDAELEGCLVKLVEEMSVKNSYDYYTLPLYQLIEKFEMDNEICLNLDVRTLDNGEPYVTFDRKVINSMATDREILVATIDMIGLLITGNQLVMGLTNQG